MVNGRFKPPFIRGADLVILPTPISQFEDGMGPIASNPEAVAELLKRYGKNLAPMLDDFLEQFDTIIKNIKTCEYEPMNNSCRFIYGVVNRVGNTFKALKNVFTATPRIFRRAVLMKPQPM